MKLIPMYKADAEGLRPWSGTILRIIAVLSVIGGFFENLLLEAIVFAVFVFAFAKIIDCLHEISVYTKGYYIIDDEQKQQTQEWDENTGNQYQNFV